MKILSLALFIAFSCSVWAQKTIFIRVYNLSGKKINKGHLLSVTDSTLLLEGKNSSLIIPVTSIGFIKTNRSAGNNLLIGSLAGGATLAIAGAVSSNPDKTILSFTPAQGAATGAAIGLPVGAMIGALDMLFKHSKKYLINGDTIKWKLFQATVTN